MENKPRVDKTQCQSAVYSCNFTESILFFLLLLHLTNVFLTFFFSLQDVQQYCKVPNGPFYSWGVRSFGSNCTAGDDLATVFGGLTFCLEHKFGFVSTIMWFYVCFERLLSGEERQSKENTRYICFSFSFKWIVYPKMTNSVIICTLPLCCSKPICLSDVSHKRKC